MMMMEVLRSHRTRSPINFIVTKEKQKTPPKTNRYSALLIGNQWFNPSSVYLIQFRCTCIPASAHPSKLLQHHRLMWTTIFTLWFTFSICFQSSVLKLLQHEEEEERLIISRLCEITFKCSKFGHASDIPCSINNSAAEIRFWGCSWMMSFCWCGPKRSTFQYLY